MTFARSELRSRRAALGALAAPGTLVAAFASLVGLTVPAALLGGCDCSGRISGAGDTMCVTSTECPTGSTCLDRRCQAQRPDGGGPVGSCTADPPRPVPEQCNGSDDDCDGEADEGVLSTCGDCDPTCEGEQLGPDGTPFDPEGHADGSESDAVGLDPTGAIVLDSRRIETAFIWIANTGEGTVSKVDTRTRVEVARYRTGPSGAADDPSRTSVNSLGDVYVANRAGQSVTKISVLGADCPDTNGDGVVRTSTGPTDVLPWGQDDCVLWNVPLTGGGILRAAAAQDTFGPDGEIITAVWIGGWDGRLWKLDGETGAVLVDTASPTNNYGFALDAMGNLWISGRSARVLGRVDTRRCLDTASCGGAPCGADGGDCIKQQIPVPGIHNPYGITVDASQRVWIAMHGTQTIARYEPAAGAWEMTNVGVDCHGIAADGAGWIWAAGYGSGVVRLDGDDPSRFLIVPGTGSPAASKGMAIDFDGNVWSINQTTNDATVIEPGPTLTDAVVTTSVVPVGANRYTYSDMTGQQLRLATDPRGWYRRPFEGCPEGGADTEWRDLRFEADVPPGTMLRFRVRTAPTRAELASAMWVLVGERPPASSPLSIGDALDRASVEPQRWIEVEVQLEAMRSSATEIISPRLRALTVTRACGPLVF